MSGFTSKEPCSGVLGTIFMMVHMLKEEKTDEQDV